MYILNYSQLTRNINEHKNKLVPGILQQLIIVKNTPLKYNINDLDRIRRQNYKKISLLNQQINQCSYSQLVKQNINKQKNQSARIFKQYTSQLLQIQKQAKKIQKLKHLKGIERQNFHENYLIIKKRHQNKIESENTILEYNNSSINLQYQSQKQFTLQLTRKPKSLKKSRIFFKKK